MATLVKIDPKSLGIGQYQHDVDQKLLERKLQEGVENLVNRVGVDVNSASASLLSYVAGVGKTVAKNIVIYRESNGVFRSKKELLKVKGLGAKAYEQMAGFIRIREGKSIFDNTGIHPESYEMAKKLGRIQNKSTRHLPKLGTGALAPEFCEAKAITSDEFCKKFNVKILAEEFGIGEATLKDIIKELAKPGFDPREELEAIPFKDDLTDISLLKEGSMVSGVVRNIADFGAFVDIGLKNDGMIHISQMSEKRIKHPLEVLSVNQYLPNIRVLSIEIEKGKVALTLKDIG